MDLYEEFLGIIDALESARIDYAVCGGVAVAIHGYSRFTKDIDLLIQRQDLERVLAVVSQLGFLDPGGEMAFDKGTPNERTVFRISKFQGPDFLTLDLLLVSPVFGEPWRDRDVALWRGRQLKVVSRQGLTIMKTLAGRDQDLLDLKKLELANDSE